MINQLLHRQPVGLDSSQHSALKLQLPVTDWSVANRLNALFVAAAEFGDVCREFPIVFVKAGQDAEGKDEVAPLAVLGLTQEQNLYVQDSQWRAHYIPALLRLYPFCIARVDAERFAVCLDMAYAGLGTAEGQPLFKDDGKPTEFLESIQKQLETLEAETQRTRLVGRRLLELGVLREMRFDATLPDGRQHTVDGFLTVDDQKMTALPDTVVGELHRSGILGLVHLHWVSMGNMRRLLEWHLQRLPVQVPGFTAPTAAPAAGTP